MKGFEWLENEDLYGPVTEEHKNRLGDKFYALMTEYMRLVDFVACFAAKRHETLLLRFSLDKGAHLNNTLWNYSYGNCEFILIDAGIKPLDYTFSDTHQIFINSRNSARLAAILTMRAIRRLGSIYRDPARMVGRAIWAPKAASPSRAYYLEESEESGSQKKK